VIVYSSNVLSTMFPLMKVPLRENKPFMEFMSFATKA